MNQSFDSFITAIEPHIPGTLISPDNLSEIKDIARIFPAKLSSLFGFECRLGEESPRADFALPIQAPAGGREILAGYDSNSKLPAFFQTNSVWQRVQRFCRHWADAASVLHENTDHIWLEFDVIEQNVSATPVPSFFFAPKGIESGGSRNIQANPHQWVSESALSVLMGCHISSLLENNILQCFDSLPNGSGVCEIGTMLSRPLEAVRICVRNIPPEGIARYLSDLQWDGSITGLKKLVLNLPSLVDRITLHVDVISDNATFIGPKIGLECYVDTSPDSEDNWSVLLDYLVQRGMCVPAKRDALMDFPGYTDEYTDREVWPQHLLGLSALLGIHNASVIQRMLHHIKIVYLEDGLLEAKAYVGAFHTWGKPLPQKKALNDQ